MSPGIVGQGVQEMTPNPLKPPRTDMNPRKQRQQVAVQNPGMRNIAAGTVLGTDRIATVSPDMVAVIAPKMGGLLVAIGEYGVVSIVFAIADGVGKPVPLNIPVTIMGFGSQIQPISKADIAPVTTTIPVLIARHRNNGVGFDDTRRTVWFALFLTDRLFNQARIPV